MNSFGRVFRISIFGESYSNAVGVCIDGCPPGINLISEDFKKDLLRRKPGDIGTTKRIEEDLPQILSGVNNDKTTGAPILIQFLNKNLKSSDYEKFQEIPRPGHADFTALKKYKGFNDRRGGGHFSGRLTVGLVAAGAIAKKIIEPIKIQSRILEIGGCEIKTQEAIDEIISVAIKNNDSVGGIIECTSDNVTVGLGEPFFDSAESMLSHIIFSIPAIKAIEFGAGFSAARMTGSQHNDSIIDKDGKTATNNAGGLNGGITNGNSIIFRVAVKPTSSISKTQKSINMKTGQSVELKIEGRHDTCIALRMPVIIEAATAIVLADFKLIN